MLTAQRTFLKHGLALLDALTLAVAFTLAYLVVGRVFGREFNGLQRYAWLLGLILPIWISGFIMSGLYRSGSYGSCLELLRRLIEVQAMAGLVLLSTLFLTRSEQISRLLVWAFLLISFAALLTQKLCLKAYLDSLSQLAKPKYHKVVLVGEVDDENFYLDLVRRHAAMRSQIVGIITPTPDPTGGSSGPVLGTVEDFLAGLGRRLVVDEVVTVSHMDAHTLRALADWCATRGTILRVMVQVPPARGFWRAEQSADGNFMLSLANVPQQPARLAIKRAIDVIGALAGLVLCGVAFLWYGRRLCAESGASPIFAQERVGCNGRRFTLYKFRTMCGDAESRLIELKPRNHMNGPMFKLKDDPRVTPTGQKLRRHHLDELPQFWNVLCGEMSLVGTRPPTVDEVEAYQQHHHRRLSMKPGITGIWQLSGNGKVSRFDEVVKLDCEYIDNWSLMLDARILVRTVAKVIRSDGW